MINSTAALMGQPVLLTQIIPNTPAATMQGMMTAVMAQIAVGAIKPAICGLKP